MQVNAISNNIQVIQVAVGVLIRGSGALREVFVARRGSHQHQGGLLEFPGGKCEAGESIELAMARELREELGIVFSERTTLRPLIEIPWHYGVGLSQKRVHLNVLEVQHWTGEPRGVEAQEAAWMRIADLDPRHFPAANRGIIIALQASVFVQVTPEFPSLRALEASRQRLTDSAIAPVRRERTADLAASLSSWLMSPPIQRLRSRLSILLRAKHLSARDYAEQAALLQKQVFTEAWDQQPVPLGIYLDHGNGGGLSAGDLQRWLRAFSGKSTPEQSLPRASAFIHLTSAQCEYWSDRLDTGTARDEYYCLANEASATGGYGPLRKMLELPDFCLLSASVHSQEALWQAVLLGVDQVFISPVARTQSHPEVRPLGWSGFAHLTRECPVPAFALGGLTDQDFGTAIIRGGQGIAAIRGFGFSDT
ncbi:NUDIX domain-containing protein [Allohahella marinimesophila]|uniref:8-oxo-dGTP diphosphatase n=1 Tax=Allohahella marinimesophila TaxID=1054972 RepID=A0ABP7NFG8_9GAMM